MNKEAVKIKPIGDQALIVIFRQEISETVHNQVMALQREVKNYFTGTFLSNAGETGQNGRDYALSTDIISHDVRRDTAKLPGNPIIDMVPAYASLTIYYDILYASFEEMKKVVLQCMANLVDCETKVGKTIEIPVCYGGIYGPDLAYVAEYHNLSMEKVIELHSQTGYRVYMLGFLPGFPYLGGLNEQLETPRLASPRVEIPAGSVGIGGKQTGIYPVASPGGWQLIGRTPVRLFQEKGSAAVPIYQPGDMICFRPISEKEYIEIQEANYGSQSIK